MSLLTPHTTASCCDTTINLAIILSNKVSILGSTQFFVNLKIIAPWYSLSLRWDLPRHCPVTCVDIDISQDSDYPAQCLWAMSRRDNEVTATRTIHKPQPTQLRRRMETWKHHRTMAEHFYLPSTLWGPNNCWVARMLADPGYAI